MSLAAYASETNEVRHMKSTASELGLRNGRRSFGHADDALPCFTTFIWIVRMIGWKFASSNQKHYPDLGSGASSV